MERALAGHRELARGLSAQHFDAEVAAASCKRSASIALPRDVTVFCRNARAAAESGQEPAFTRNEAERVYLIEAAHNPEVAGSNLPPLHEKALETGPFRLMRQGRPRSGRERGIQLGECLGAALVGGGHQVLGELLVDIESRPPVGFVVELDSDRRLERLEAPGQLAGDVYDAGEQLAVDDVGEVDVDVHAKA